MHRAADETRSFSVSELNDSPASLTANESSYHSGAGWDWKTFFILLLITIVGGYFRFYRLTYPALWNDEALVYWRACGTYGEMLQPLSLDGFPPLHYSLYWLIGHLDTTYWLPMTWPVGMMLLGIIGWVVCLAVDNGRKRSPMLKLWAIFAAIIALGVIWQFQLIHLLAADEPGYWLYGLLRVLDLPEPQVHSIYLGRVEHAIKMTPFVMRIVPAIFGLLNVPAIYFLARQMFSKSTSLVAAAFTACSAFMLFYSRDAKMYPDLWLFITLNVGCMLWWFRTGFSIAWLCWIAAGCAMVGLHASAFAIPVISILMFFTQRQVNWKKTIWFLLGLFIIASGPVVYATKFNHWTERVEQEGWKESGIGWVNGFFNGNRTGPDHALYTSASFLIGYEWPRDDYVVPTYEQPIDPALLEAPQTAYEMIFWVLAAGALPWPLMWRPKSDLDHQTPEPQWRIYFWLGSWILVCAYGAYCHSVRHFESPRRWDYEILEWLSVWGVVGSAAIMTGFIVLAAMHRNMWPALLRFFQFIAVTAVLYGICWGIFQLAWPAATKAMADGEPWQSIWTPRYLGFIWPAVGIATAALLMRLPTRPVRIACIFFVLAVNVAMAALRLELTTEPPIDELARDVSAAQDANSTVRTFDFINYGDIAVSGSSIGENPHLASGRYYLAMESGRPMTPDTFVNSYYTYKLRSDPDAQHIKRTIQASPQLKHVIFWSQVWPGEPIGFDPYRSTLPPGWRLASEEVHTIRIYWDWRQRWKWVRREYVKK